MDKIADAAWICGDPGMQYDSTINDWHTCPNTDRIYASNPCSEFVFLNDTACNLASLNLLTFRDEQGNFDVETFRRAVALTITAQEILVPNASYPTPRIEKNSHAFRPLGLGYTNLGALLMVRGLPYDSDEGRAWAGAITALMCGEAYLQSAKIAESTGPFAGYPVNEAPMLRVIKKHAEAVDDIGEEFKGIEDTRVFQAAKKSWSKAYELGQKVGYRNSQVTVLAPTGCMTADTMLLSSEGLLPIGDLGDVYGEDWQVLDARVPQEREVHAATQFFVNGEDRVIGLTTRRGHRIKATWKHQLRVIDEYGHYAWRRMDAIQPGDQIVMRVGGHESVLEDRPHLALSGIDEALHPRAHDVKTPPTLDAAFGEWLGYYMGDGYLKERGGVHMVIHDQDEDVRQHFTDQARALFGLAPTIESRQGCSVLHCNSRALYRWFKANEFDKPIGNEGQGAHGAFIPQAVLRSNTSVLCAFLRGLFEADGSVYTTRSGSPVVSMTTVSPVLARQVHTALEALGVRATLTAREASDDSFGARVKFRVRPASVSDIEVFAHKIGFLSSRKRALLDQALTTFSGCKSRGHNITSEAVLADFYERSEGLPSEVRQDIRARLVQGRANVEWFARLIEEHASLGSTKAATLLALGDLQFVEVDEIEELGMLPTFDISVPHRNTYVANGFVSHNTISFLMDCDTTGIEPDIALIKYKKLVGGGYFKIVNQAVPEALSALGYSKEQTEAIIDYTMEHGTIEGAPHLKDGHLPVFDCAFKAQHGSRSIEPMGHVRMMAAAQPFLSGAISKTVNMPPEATREDIASIYIESWRLGLKAVAIYRDGCKRTQPLSTSLDTGNEERTPAEQVADDLVARAVTSAPTEPGAPSVAPAPLKRRRRLPDERPSITHKFSIAGHEGYITVGMYEDGQPGEIFIVMSKEGSVVSGLMDSFATSTSLCLQYGVPLEVLVDKFSFTRFEPSGYTNNPRIRMAHSITDYLFRWLADKFMGADTKGRYFSEATDDDAPIGVNARQHSDQFHAVSRDQAAEHKAAAGGPGFADAPAGSVVYDAAKDASLQSLQSDAPPCGTCGGITVRAGACYSCPNCGATTGCG